MTGNTRSASLSRDTEVAAPLEIAAPGPLYEADFSKLTQKTRNRSLSRPSGVRLRCGRRRLTKTEEEESIIINRPDRSTYPEQKSVSTSGATPVESTRTMSPAF
jgi:hypothetical protein